MVADRDPGRARRALVERGFVRLPALLDAGAVAKLHRDVEGLQHQPERPGRSMMYFDPAPEEPAGRRLNRVENFVPYHPALDAVVRGPALQGAVEAVLGEPVVLFKDKVNFKLPGGGSFEPHQDAQAGWNEYAGWFVTAAVAVDPATVENGCLELAAWSHRRELIGPLWQPLGPEELREMVFEPMPMQAGDAVLFDSYLPHRSGPNTTGEPRRVLYVTYNRAAEGDQRARYYEDKRRSYPPDCERTPDRRYAYKV